jgi:antitoxin CptB
MDDIRLKRLIYRSWHRGCKETDLILGRFANNGLPNLPPAMLDLYEALLEENDADIWNWLTGKAHTPEEYELLLAMLQRDGTETE